jgi:hypothetical protein
LFNSIGVAARYQAIAVNQTKLHLPPMFILDHLHANAPASYQSDFLKAELQYDATCQIFQVYEST